MSTNDTTTGTQRCDNNRRVRYAIHPITSISWLGDDDWERIINIREKKEREGMEKETTDLFPVVRE